MQIQRLSPRVHRFDERTLCQLRDHVRRPRAPDRLGLWSGARSASRDRRRARRLGALHASPPRPVPGCAGPGDGHQGRSTRARGRVVRGRRDVLAHAPRLRSVRRGVARNTLSESVRVDRRLSDYEVVVGRPAHRDVPTPGHTRGSVTYLVRSRRPRLGVQRRPHPLTGRVWSVHDLEWWYGLGEGARVAATSARALRGRAPDRLAPSHGEVMDAPDAALAELQANLRRYVGPAIRATRSGLGPDPFVEDDGSCRCPRPRPRASPRAPLLRPARDDGSCAVLRLRLPELAPHRRRTSASSSTRLDELRGGFGVRSERLVATHYHDDHVARLRRT